ncbi:MAG: ABC transporter ATP-binding protein [Phycisphaerales bacterium]|nr:ABC transporter ATP-binding protein [Phycisphaerales bacterium]
MGVHKSFAIGDRKVHALRGLDLEITESGFYGIMGRSGCGKSTLLHLMAAMDRPDSGEIFVSGKPVHALSERDATMYRRRDIGVVFQAFNLIPTMNALENVLLPGLLGGDNTKELAKRGMELLDLLGLDDRSTHRPEALSGGEQQRVAIARALLYKPAVVFADEPTGNLDSQSSNLVWALLARIADEQQITVVMVTHEIEAAKHCSKVFVMADGTMRGVIDTNEEGGLDAGGIATRTQHLLGASE